MKSKLLIITLISLLLCACTTKKETLTDAKKFKKEYEKYNKTHLKLSIDEDNIIKYTTVKKANKLLKKTAVIFIGNPQDDLSRASISLLLKASSSTNLDTIYYLKTTSGLNLDDDIDKTLPLVINIKDGKIISTHNKTINDKYNLTKEEQEKLYKIYLEGINNILGDTCNERC